MSIRNWLSVVHIITTASLGFWTYNINKRTLAESDFSVSYGTAPSQINLYVISGTHFVFDPDATFYDHPDLMDMLTIRNIGDTRSNETLVTLVLSDPFSIEGIAVRSASKEWLESEKTVIPADRENYTKVTITINDPIGPGEAIEVILLRVYRAEMRENRNGAQKGIEDGLMVTVHSSEGKYRPQVRNSFAISF